MPLHLLGKKSWNVYNADNIERVRRDEAAAKAAEEAEEQRMQEVDAQRRLAILRGETPPPLEDRPDEDIPRIEGTASGARPPPFHGSSRKSRKRYGEDDTDFELRLATERNDAKHSGLEVTQRKSTSSAPIVDQAGHIDLFGDERARAHAEKNEEAEAEAKKKKREYEDQYTMRFSNAAGKEGLDKPWYSTTEGTASDSTAKNVWGEDDPTRRDRDTRRISSNDPLAMMKKGASQIRELKKERKRIQEERDAELRDLRTENHRARRRGEHGRGERHHTDARKQDSRSRHSKDRSRDRHRSDNNERRRHKQDERRRRHSRSRSPDKRPHRHRYKGDT